MLEKKRILITGASRGIGAAIAELASEYGADIILNYNKSKLEAEELAAKLETMGSRVLVVQGDVSREEHVKKLFMEIKNEFDGLDGLVNNAGISEHAPFEEVNAEHWDRIININLKSMFLCSKEAFPLFKRVGAGKIVNNSSMLEFVARFGLVAYTTAKAGVGGLTRSLSLEMAKDNIQVNSVCPGVIQTEILGGRLETDIDFRSKTLAIIPSNRFGTAKEVAELFIFLLSNKANYITGASIPVDGGILAARH